MLLNACLNGRNHVVTNVALAEGPGGTNRCCDCDGYRLDTLAGRNGRPG